MFWTNKFPSKTISRAGLDGSKQTGITTMYTVRRYMLALDFEDERIYWVELDIVMSASLNGSDQQIFLEDIRTPYGLVLYGNFLYFAEESFIEGTNAVIYEVQRINKTDPAHREVVIGNLYRLRDIKVYHRNRAMLSNHPCLDNNGGCSDLYLPRPGRQAGELERSCLCPNKQTYLVDNFTCVVNAYLLFPTMSDIRQIILDVPPYTESVLPIGQINDTASADVDLRTNEIYWTNGLVATIFKSPISGRLPIPVIKSGLVSPRSVSVDWIGGTLYWLDSGLRRIEVAHLNGSNRRALVFTDLVTPNGLAIDLKSRAMFWTDIGNMTSGIPAKIERASMDGNARMAIVTSQMYVRMPRSITVDYPMESAGLDGHLYWTDSLLGTIFSSSLLGEDVRPVKNGLGSPYGLAIYGDLIFWTELSNQRLYTADKTNGSNTIQVITRLPGLQEVRIIRRADIAIASSFNHPCYENRGCSDLCLPSQSFNNFTCACQMGIQLESDGLTCRKSISAMPTIITTLPASPVASTTPALSATSNALAVNIGSSVASPVASTTPALSATSNTLAVNIGSSVASPVASMTPALSATSNTLAVNIGSSVASPVALMTPALSATSNALAIIIGSSVGSITLLLVIALVFVTCVFLCWRRRKSEAMDDIELSIKSSAAPRLQRGMTQIVKAKMVIFNSNIRLLDSIGEGEFGVVYKAHLIVDVIGMPEMVAIKTVKHYYSTEENSALLRESVRMMDLDHPNVLGLIGVCVDAGPAPYLVMPYMAQGSLLSYLKKHRPDLVFFEGAEQNEDKTFKVEKKLLDMCIQIAKGMEYLASHHLIHRDLAARNCMLDMHSVIKVADFGLTEEMFSRNYFRQGQDSTVRLPIKWMALESLSDGLFTEATDVWSFGVTCWEVYSGGCSPYAGIDHFTLQQQLAMGKRLNKPLNIACGSEVYDTMLACWKIDPTERPTFSLLVVSLSGILDELAGYFNFKAENYTSTFGSTSTETVQLKEVPSLTLEEHSGQPAENVYVPAAALQCAPSEAVENQE